MLERNRSKAEKAPRVFRKDVFEDGTPVRLQCVELDGQVYAQKPTRLRVARLEEEWFNDVRDPVSVIAALANSELNPDLFTFWQRLPDMEPKYDYFNSWDSIAVLPITSFDFWFNSQIKTTARNKLRKSQKAGVEVRETIFDDDFVRGMVDIFNESPVRQGRPFWHYGKDFETVKRQFSRALFREQLIGAYYNGELIGFSMLADTGRFAQLGQFISKFQHRDKAANNAMIAKAVELCEKRGFPYLTYSYWGDSSLVEFKRSCGFEEVRLPRYFVPLTLKGKVALKFGFGRLQGTLKQSLPPQIKAPLKRLKLRLLGLPSH